MPIYCFYSTENFFSACQVPLRIIFLHQKMATKARGRGYALSKNAQSGELRRPGETSMGISNASKINGKEPVLSKSPEDNIEKICNTMAAIDLSLPQSALETFAGELKAVCKTSELLEKCAENLFQFALKSKWNAHAVAVFCNFHGEITVEQVKLRNLFFKKLQGRYLERSKAYQELDKFLLDATFACEVFHHVRIAGAHLKVLSGPVLDYFGMLLTGASQKEVEVVMEQFPKCYKNIKDCDGFDDLLTKLRKQIISETTTVTVKAMMLELFELILTDWKVMNPSAKTFYETLSKPIVRICD
ncbi:hypothetical protein JTE90_024426 [Oedothorax gibbosus]|uniref:Uncharacterized protein n=1 Tax=Oedothorax gibbosus TaxID=931172 RepID=A0AAV6UF74_9ARAC|nr:hypothetical protein JTE90_024426 [Oedothorax gibbosus]